MFHGDFSWWGCYEFPWHCAMKMNFRSWSLSWTPGAAGTTSRCPPPFTREKIQIVNFLFCLSFHSLARVLGYHKTGKTLTPKLTLVILDVAFAKLSYFRMHNCRIFSMPNLTNLQPAYSLIRKFIDSTFTIRTFSKCIIHKY